MDTLKTFRTASFVIVVREPTSDERATVGFNRDALTVSIRRKRERASLTMTVGSAMTGWNGDECTSAAQSAISFASAYHCFDEERDVEWSLAHGEDLTNEAFCHRTLGAEMRASYA